MIPLQSASAGALEAAIRARIAIDSRAKQLASELEGKRVRITYNGENLIVEFRDRTVHARRAADEEDADLSIAGTVVEIGKLLVSDQPAQVEIVGDEALLERFRGMFKPRVDAENVAKRAKATAEYGVAAIRSALEGIASEFTANKDQQSDIEALTERVRQLQAAVEKLDKRLQDLEQR